MINFNGRFIPSKDNQLYNNRAFLFGDAVFETLKIVEDRILFFEDHYFRLMSSMRILRMDIPMNFTMEFIKNQILGLVDQIEKSPAYRVRFTVYRNSDGLYLPKSNKIGFLIDAKPLKTALYTFSEKNYEVDLYKDFYVTKQLFSSIKSTNRAINIVGSIFAQENGLDNCLLMNDSKNVVEALNGNVFMFFNNKLFTPPVSEGCIVGILRKQVIAIIRKTKEIELIEQPISPFDLQKADELFITNIIQGIQPITKYRKKEFNTDLAKDILLKLNLLVQTE